MYRPGDVVQYERAAKPRASSAAASVWCGRATPATNGLTVELSNGSSVEYDPKRIYGVNVYRETSREFATGDRLQFSALNKELGISNRDMGTITKMEPDRLTVLMDGKEKRSVSFNPAEFRQFDHGYAVTSHSSQGLTADRVIANMDTDSSRSLINSRLAYVAISRASEDAGSTRTMPKRCASASLRTSPRRGVPAGLARICSRAPQSGWYGRLRVPHLAGFGQEGRSCLHHGGQPSGRSWQSSRFLIRPIAIRTCPRMRSRPANPGGGEPAPGEYGLRIGSI